MATNTLTLVFNGDQKLTVNSVLNQKGDGYSITSIFAGVTIKNGAGEGAGPAPAAWHNGPVWLDLNFNAVNFNAMCVLLASGTATTSNGASQIAQFNVIANAGYVLG